MPCCREKKMTGHERVRAFIGHWKISFHCEKETDQVTVAIKEMPNIMKVKNHGVVTSGDGDGRVPVAKLLLSVG